MTIKVPWIIERSVSHVRLCFVLLAFEIAAAFFVAQKIVKQRVEPASDLSQTPSD